MIYAGIGSRETPVEIMRLMYTIASDFALRGYTLRSGGAKGADSAFESGCDAKRGQKEIYLPWKGFNGKESNYKGVSPEALEIAKKYHPAWDRLSPAAELLMGRNVYQVLGYFLKSPADFIVCWTKDGKASGGTGQAIRIATDLTIPVFNLYHGTTELKQFIGKEP